MLRIGFLLSFTAVFLQIAVFLQPLLPKQYQIAPVCETITRALFEPINSHLSTVSTSHQSHSNQVGDVHQDHSAEQHQATIQSTSVHSDHNHHDVNHQCQYCTVFGNLVLPPELHVKEVLVRVQVRLIAYQKAFKHVYFVLQRLYLLPQGRAPPLYT